VNTYDWYKARIYKLDEDSSYDPTNYDSAWEKAREWDDRIPIGVVFQDAGRPTYEDQVPEIADAPLAHQAPERSRDVLEAIKREFM
jgi:2-oxoglutarate ferredoxin oxidoreductase subunit beta